MTLEPPATSTGRKRISWINVLTVASVIVLVGSEIFGAAFAGGWAVGNLLGFGELTYLVIAVFCGLGAYAMAGLLKACLQVEPIIVDADNADRQSDG